MRLIDAFSEIFAFTAYFLRSVEGAGSGNGSRRPLVGSDSGGPPASRSVVEVAQSQKGLTFEAVRDNYQRLFARSEETCRRGRFRQDDYDRAKFAVCAWVDEAISNSDWPEKMKWPKEELQRVFFRTTNAGEEFFRHMQSLTPAQKEVMEVYATCLALGFQGRYFGEYGHDELAALRLSSVRNVAGSVPNTFELGQRCLFPGAYSEEVAAGGPRSQAGSIIATVVIALLPVLLFAGLYIFFNWQLDNTLDSVLGR